MGGIDLSMNGVAVIIPNSQETTAESSSDGGEPSCPMMEEESPRSNYDERLETLRKMLLAENVNLQQSDHVHLLKSSCDTPRSSSSSSCPRPSNVWREKVAQWCYDVADRLGESRSCVYVAMNVLDRYCAHYCASTRREMDERKYEIVSMTSLFLAVRIAGSGNFQIQDMLGMSSDGIVSQDIVSTGTEMIKALSWEHRIITPFDFVNAFIELLVPASSSLSSRSTILDSATYLVELAVCDNSLSAARPSEIALAALLNSARAELCCYVNDFSAFVSASTGIDTESEGILSLRNRLHKLYSLSYDNRTTSSPHLVVEEEEEDVAALGGGEDYEVSFRSSATVRNISECSLCPAACE